MQETLVGLPKGTSLHALAEDLEQRGLISNALFFQIWVKLHRHSYEHFMAGTYRFTEAVSPTNIMRKMLDGDTYNPVVLEYTIPEGARFAQVITTLVELGVGAEEDYHQLASDPVWLSSMGITGVEGFLFPATYRFFNTKPTVKEALERAIKEFFARIPPNYKERLDAYKLTLEQWVSFASLIERETAWDEERPKISAVIWGRLKSGMSLGIDAALIYGIKDYAGNITRAHLQDPTNLYNNRIHRGLPPTPIASPSLASLEAVFNPVSEPYYYFVLIPDSGRKHHFSKSFKEHSIHVRRLVEAQRVGIREPVHIWTHLGGQAKE